MTPETSTPMFATLRAPTQISWTPQADITAHELALAMPVLLAFAGGAAIGFQPYLGNPIATLPEGVQRHFRIRDHERDGQDHSSIGHQRAS